MTKNKSSITKGSFHWIILCLTVGILAGAIQAIQIKTNGIGDSDYFWHIALGKHIVENRSIFEQDVFSWIAAERGYIETAHSWLGSVIIYLFSTLFADPVCGASLYAFATSAATSFITAYAWGSPWDRDNQKCVFINGLSTIMAGLSVVICGTSPRPLSFGILLFVISMLLLHDGFEDLKSRKCWGLPMISVLWANLHGGSVPILFAFTGMFLILSFLPACSWKGIGQSYRRSAARIKRFTGLLVSSIAAALINPYGYRLFIYFFFTNNAATKDYISEWQPAYLLNLSVVLAIGILLITALIRRDQKPAELSYLLPVFATLFMTGLYIRISPYLILCSVMYFSHSLHSVFGEKEPRKLNTLTIGRLNALILAIAVTMTCVSIQTRSKTDSETPGDTITPELITALQEIRPERMYTGYNDGGYLIYHGFQSFIDSRADLFPGAMLKRAIEFEDIKNFTAQEIDSYIAEYDFDAILAAPKRAISIWLTVSPDWEPAFEDERHILFVRAQIKKS